jgi:hypothetical protein
MRGRGGYGSDKACLIIKGLLPEAVPHHCSRDLALAIVFYKGGSGTPKRLMAAAPNSPSDKKNCPPEEPTAIDWNFGARGAGAALGCDTNARHLVSDSSDTIPKGAELVVYLYTWDPQNWIC